LQKRALVARGAKAERATMTSDGGKTPSGLNQVAGERMLQAYQRREKMLDDSTPIRLRRDYLIKHGLVAVPFEDATHFTEETALTLCDACREYAYEKALVIPLVDDQQCCFEMPLTVEAFMALGDIDITWQYFVIVEVQDRFAILVDELFNTIAGSPGFVCRGLGQWIEETEKDFLDNWVRDSFFSDSEKKSFEELVAFYRSMRVG
jgi:hypothetical protein